MSDLRPEDIEPLAQVVMGSLAKPPGYTLVDLYNPLAISVDLHMEYIEFEREESTVGRRKRREEDDTSVGNEDVWPQMSQIEAKRLRDYAIYLMKRIDGFDYLLYEMLEFFPLSNQVNSSIVYAYFYTFTIMKN